jgi:hypothetical protein
LETEADLLNTSVIASINESDEGDSMKDVVALRKSTGASGFAHREYSSIESMADWKVRWGKVLEQDFTSSKSDDLTMRIYRPQLKVCLFRSGLELVKTYNFWEMRRQFEEELISQFMLNARDIIKCRGPKSINMFTHCRCAWSVW